MTPKFDYLLLCTRYILYFYYRCNDENSHIWYDHMEPPHPHINKDITDVLFNSEKFKFGSMFFRHSFFVSINIEMIQQNNSARLYIKSYLILLINIGIHRVGHLVESLRVVKSPSEISLLKKCTSITAQGFMKVLRMIYSH